MQIHDVYTQEQLANPSLDMSDALLAQWTLAGDQRAFEVIVQRYHALLFSFVYRLLGDYDLAFDVLQQVFLRFYIALPKLGTEGPFKQWLFRVAYNCCIDELRHRRKCVIHFSQLEADEDEGGSSFLYDIPDMRPLPEEIVERDDLRQLLLKAIQSLPPRFRNVVLLRYISQLSFREIGQTLDMQEVTAKTYFHRAKQLLHKTLSPQLQVPSL